MSEKQSYPTIEASAKTLRILKFVASKSAPATVADVEREFDIKYATVMTHLITLEREGYIERAGNGFVGGFLLSSFWAKRKALNDKKRRDLDAEDKELGY